MLQVLIPRRTEFHKSQCYVNRRSRYLSRCILQEVVVNESKLSQITSEHEGPQSSGALLIFVHIQHMADLEITESRKSFQKAIAAWHCNIELQG